MGRGGGAAEHKGVGKTGCEDCRGGGASGGGLCAHRWEGWGVSGQRRTRSHKGGGEDGRGSARWLGLVVRWVGDQTNDKCDMTGSAQPPLPFPSLCPCQDVKGMRPQHCGIYV